MSWRLRVAVFLQPHERGRLPVSQCCQAWHRVPPRVYHSHRGRAWGVERQHELRVIREVHPRIERCQLEVFIHGLREGQGGVDLDTSDERGGS